MTSHYRSIVTIGLHRTVSEINVEISRKSHANRQFFLSPACNAPVQGFPFELCTSQRSQETRMMRLSCRRKGFQIDLAVLIQYRRVAGRVAGCPSHAGIVSKRLNLSENFFDLLKASSLYFLETPVPIHNSKENPSSGGVKYTRVRKLAIFVQFSDIAVYLGNGAR